jgi:hypothetical protein
MDHRETKHGDACFLRVLCTLFSAISAVKGFFENCLTAEFVGQEKFTARTAEICLACITFLM